MAKKKMVTRIEALSLEDFEGPVNEITEWLEGYFIKYGPNVRLIAEYGWGNEMPHFELKYEEKETDFEQKKRLAKAKKLRDINKADKVKKEERERKELERLQKKYA